MKTEDLLKFQARQFRRLLETKRLKFEDAYYVIFSDYPCVGSMAALRDCAGEELGEDIYSKLLKEIHNRK